MKESEFLLQRALSPLEGQAQITAPRTKQRLEPGLETQEEGVHSHPLVQRLCHGGCHVKVQERPLQNQMLYGFDSRMSHLLSDLGRIPYPPSAASVSPSETVSDSPHDVMRTESLSTPTAGFCQALACPTGGPGQRCRARVAGLQAYLRLRDERPPRRRRARRRRRKEPAEPETVRGGCSCQDNE